MEPIKTLILIRHAHRNTDEPSRDNGLSQKGEEQVKKLIQYAQKRLVSRDLTFDDEAESQALFLCSPKKRCQETLAPLAKAMSSKLIIDERLTEALPFETAKAYDARISDFLRFWKKEGPAVTLLCSHGDWIPMAVQQLTGAKIGIKKAGWIEIQLVNGEAYLSWLLQKV